MDQSSFGHQSQQCMPYFRVIDCCCNNITIGHLAHNINNLTLVTRYCFFVSFQRSIHLLPSCVCDMNTKFSSDWCWTLVRLGLMYHESWPGLTYHVRLFVCVCCRPISITFSKWFLSFSNWCVCVCVSVWTERYWSNVQHKPRRHDTLIWAK